MPTRYGAARGLKKGALLDILYKRAYLSEIKPPLYDL